MHFYSKTTRGFYDEAIHGPRELETAVVDGEETRTVRTPNPRVPADAVEVSDEEHAALMAAQADGHTIEPDASGRPVAVPHPAPTIDQLRSQVFPQVRQARKAALDALTGIGFRAVLAGDRVLAEQAAAAQALLLSITSDAEVLAVRAEHGAEALLGAVRGALERAAAAADDKVRHVVEEVRALL